MLKSFPPSARSDAINLVLGSMPGNASLQAGEYYAHPRNLFWRIMGDLFDAGLDIPYDERLLRLHDNHIALWDVINSCSRQGSLDAAIRNETANNFEEFFSQHPHIQRIFFNGRKAASFFDKHITPTLNCYIPERILLPSTSPAYAGMRYEAKLLAWQQLICRLP